MRYLVGFVAVMALGVVPLVGCSGTEGTGGSGGDGGAGGSGGGGSMVTVTGQVRENSADGAVPGPTVANAMVSVLGTSNTATTDEDGTFSIMAPIGTRLFLSEATGSWGGMLAEDVSPPGITGLALEVIPETLVDQTASDLGVTADVSRGVVAVVFDHTRTVGGETAEIIEDTSELSFVFLAGEAQEGNTLFPGGGDVIFLNVDPANVVTATATSATQQPCPLEFPAATYSVRAKVITEIEVVCP